MKNPEFAAQVEQAREQYQELILQEVYRRGVEGVDEPVFYKGEEVGSITRYSDRMLALLLKRFDRRYSGKFGVCASCGSVSDSVPGNADMDLENLDGPKLEVLKVLMKPKA